jgi:hypothetical protein
VRNAWRTIPFFRRLAADDGSDACAAEATGAEAGARIEKPQKPSMLPHELIVWAMTIGRWSGVRSVIGSFCGAADAEAPHDTDTNVTAAATRVLRTRMHDTLRR